MIRPDLTADADMIKIILLAAFAVIGAVYMASELGALRQPKGADPARPRLAESDGAVTLQADADGHFRVDATIGGRRVPMLVDTGATVVALSFEQGEALGLVSGGDRFDARVTTANGGVGAKRVVLRDVRVGSVKVLDVAAVVLTRGAMNENLLGMSFLGRLRRVETARDRLTLER